MPQTKVFQSQNLNSGVYDPLTRRLSITFVSGYTYEYFPVPADVWARLCSAMSPNTYFKNFIEGRYTARKAGR
jgi:hypothetical protein